MSTRGASSPPGSRLEMKVLTFNTCFLENAMNEYDCNLVVVNEIIELINSSGADVVCLQEVTAFSKQKLDDALQKVGYTPSNKRKGQQQYFTMIYTTLEVVVDTVEQFRSSSEQGRDILKMVVRKESRLITIYNSHLESLKGNNNVRMAQLTQLLEPGAGPRIVVGDMNMGKKDFKQVFDNFESSYYDAFIVSNAPKELEITWKRLNADAPKPYCKKKFVVDGIVPKNKRPNLFPFSNLLYHFRLKSNVMQVRSLSLFPQPRSHYPSQRLRSTRHSSEQTTNEPRPVLDTLRSFWRPRHFRH